MEDSAHRLVGDGIHDLELDQLVGQERHGPPLPTGGRRRAGEGDEPGFGPTVEPRLDGRTGALLPVESRLQALLDEPRANPSDGVGAHLDGLGDALVGPGRGARAGVGLEPDPGVNQPLSGRLTHRNQIPKLLPLLVRQGNLILLHGFLSMDVPVWSTDTGQVRKSAVVVY